MRIVAFLQLYNELENGNLVRCLENCTKWADDIYIYDDCSDDGSQEVYLKYTDRGNIIFGGERDFKKELFHKQALLELTLQSNPDWIGWIDGDTTLDRALTEQCEEFLEVVQKQGWNGVKLHNLNLWRHEAYHRVDNLFNDLRHVVFWRNNGKLCYEPKAELHQQQHPKGIEEGGVFVVPEELHLLHYGFSTKMQIVKKYLTYKSLGQKGWALDRLIDEQSSFELRKVNKKCYPQENVPEDYDTAQKPEPLTYDEYRRYNSWEEYKNSCEPVERTRQSSEGIGKREVVEINCDSVSKGQESIGRDVKPSFDTMSGGGSGKPTVTIVGMIYKSTQYLDFMMDGIKKYCLNSKDYDVDYLIIGNDPVEKVRRKLIDDNVMHLIYKDPKPDDYYLNRVYRAWNFGGFNAPGEIIVFFNSDEVFSPNWLETLLEHLDRDTIPCSRLVESNKMPSGQHGMKAEFGLHPLNFDETGWLEFVENNRERKLMEGGLYMPCAFYKDDFVESGGYPEGNIYEGGVGANETKFLCSGDDYYFNYHPTMSKKRQVTDFDSLVYHIIEGEKDE